VRQAIWHPNVPWKESLAAISEENHVLHLMSYPIPVKRWPSAKYLDQITSRMRPISTGCSKDRTLSTLTIRINGEYQLNNRSGEVLLFYGGPTRE
jgi:hypothetical protein